MSNELRNPCKYFNADGDLAGIGVCACKVVRVCRPAEYDREEDGACDRLEEDIEATVEERCDSRSVEGEIWDCEPVWGRDCRTIGGLDHLLAEAS